MRGIARDGQELTYRASPSLSTIAHHEIIMTFRAFAERCLLDPAFVSAGRSDDIYSHRLMEASNDPRSRFETNATALEQ